MKKYFLIIGSLVLSLFLIISANNFKDNRENSRIVPISNTSKKYVNTLHKFTFEIPKNTKVYDGRDGWGDFKPDSSIISYVQLYDQSANKLPYRIVVYKGGANKKPETVGAIVTYPSDGDGTRYTIAIDGYYDQNKLNNGNAPASIQKAANMIENSFAFIFKNKQEGFSFHYPDGLDVSYNLSPSGESLDHHLFYIQYCGSVDCTHPIFYGLQSNANNLSEVKVESFDDYTTKEENIKIGNINVKKVTFSSKAGNSIIIRLYFFKDKLYVYEADIGSDDRNPKINQEALNLFIDSFKFIPEG